jgi:parallel beta-helix repeat protein
MAATQSNGGFDQRNAVMKDHGWCARGVISAALVLSLLSLATLVWAGPCGGDQPCKCAATVHGSVTLDRDLIGCGRVGLHLTSGAKLDCAGHTIAGSGTKKSKYGISLDGVNDAEVRNCVVSGFNRGIRVRGGKGVRVEKNTLRENRTGIETAGATARGQVLDALIADNLLEKNELDGVHVGVGTVRPRVTRNRFVENGQESLNLCGCVQCEVTENVVEDSVGAGIYARNVSGAYFADNVLKRSFFYVRGDSANNVFARNELDSGFFVFGGYTGRGTHDPGWVKVPRDSRIIGGAVTGKKYCFRFHGASNIEVRGTVTNGCELASSKPYGELQPTNNVLDVREAGADFDADGIANVDDTCTDSDGDGFGDPGFSASTCGRDNCPEKANSDQADRDGDGFGDGCDVCPAAFDPPQIDRDRDGVGDSCQACVDEDGDGRATGGGGCPGDNCPRIANVDQLDFDRDGIGDACDECPYFADASGETGAVAGEGLCGAIVPANLDAARAGRFRSGALAFTRIESFASGLGPYFNGRGCVECHSHPTVGGSSERLVTMFGRMGPHGFDPLVEKGGPALQTEGIRTPVCSAPSEAVPRGGIPRHRQSIALYGMGRIEAIAESAIVGRADPDDADGDGISGRVNRIDGRVGRFGWKADEATLEGIVAKAMQQEIGITTPLRPEEEKGEHPIECDPVADPEDDGTHLRALVEFLRALPPLPESERAAHEVRGGALFREAGCATCHVPELPASAGAATVGLFSDLLLHDMGDALGDDITAAEAAGNEFRTAPLWGVRESKPYLHDGRAESLEAAIALHGGEAGRSRDRFLGLSKENRQSLVAYLESL